VTSDSTIEALRRAAQAIESRLIIEAKAIGLSPRQLTVVLTLSEQPGLTAPGLQDATGFDKSTVSEVLRKLTAMRLIASERGQEMRSSAGRRTVPVGVKYNSLTRAGLAKAIKGREIHQKISAMVDELVRQQAEATKNINSRARFIRTLSAIAHQK
jgi:DNA-binding transcriptional regulator GbsR (MarR family)